MQNADKKLQKHKPHQSALRPAIEKHSLYIYAHIYIHQILFSCFSYFDFCLILNFYLL